MKLKIAMAGELKADQHIFGKIDLLVGQISGYLCRENADSTIQMLVSPSYTGKAWMTWNETHDFPVCTNNMRDSDSLTEHCFQVINNDTQLRNLIGEALCDKADALIVVWNEDIMELSGATWEIMQIAYDKKVPCIWISSKTSNTYCLWDSYYKKYTPQYLEAMCDPLPDGELQTVAAVEKKNWVLDFWEKRREAYLKKYKADSAVFPDKEDYLLKQDFKMEQEVSQGEAVRRVLLDKFRQFDASAIQLSSRFQAMVYQRSVLPFITTLFIAVGFYAETLIGKTASLINPALEAPVSFAAALLAGIGFLIHGCLNFYVYRLSKSQSIYNDQKDFINSRYVAELLRVLIHFLPYGIAVDLRRLCGKDRNIYNAIKHLTDEAEPEEQHIDRRTISYMLQHIKEMLADQLTYHKASANRYRAIVQSLEKWGKRIFYVGFWVVIFRGILQFILILFFMKAEGRLDVCISIGSSFLNMLALLLPAWAGYFSTKSLQNNFSYNLNNHEKMISNLQGIQERVDYFQEQEEIPMEIFHVIAEDLAEIMLIGDSSNWQNQYMNSMIKPL